MRYGTTFLLLLTAGLALMQTGRLVAEDAPAPAGCSARLAGIEQRVADAGLAACKEAQVRQIIDGARTLDRPGDAVRCADLASQLDRLLKVL
jgi:hypothetical protein